MGLIKAIVGAAGGTLADQWKEFFYCEAISNDVLAVKGQKKTSKRSSNTKGEDNIISNGSGIAVADGQCMIIVEQGKIVEVCAEPGQFTYDTSTEPSIFTGGLGEGILNTFKTIGKRFTYGGDTGKDQRVYYFNTKEILDNKYGTQNPVPFRVVDKNIGLDVDIAIRCNGVFSYKMTDPLLFYTNVCGNIQKAYEKKEIEGQLRAELLTALQPAFAQISEMGIRYSALPGHTMELASALNNILSDKWKELRGIEIVSFGINSVNASKEDEDMIKELQKSAVMRDPGMAAATLVGAQSEAMKAAAANKGGAMMGFMGLGMAQNAGGGGVNAGDLFKLSEQNKQAAAAAAGGVAGVAAGGWKCECGTVNTGKFCSNCGKPEPAPAPAEGSWTCKCGATNTGKFCAECGSPKPEAAADGWTCKCGTVNKGKFCSNCGEPKPAGAPLYKCDKCGWEPEDPMNPPKFCPECGDVFDDNDIQK